MFLLLQLISRGKKVGAALFPDKKAGGEREESGWGGSETSVLSRHLQDGCPLITK